MNNYFLSLDLGTKKIGLATSRGIISSYYGSIEFPENNLNFALEKIFLFIKKEKFNHIIIGFPKNMNNFIGYRAKFVLKFKKKLEKKILLISNNIFIKLIDERLTTKLANQYMLEFNLSRKKRKEKKDGLAAQLILETYLKLYNNNNIK